MLLIGLTGTIASGKSTVAEELRKLGATVIDADRVAREIVAPGTEGARQVRSAFGAQYFLPDGALDRKALGRLVFSDAEALKKLNAINRPLIQAEFERRTVQAKIADPQGTVVWDAPLLIEFGMSGAVDEVWVVTASDEVRIARMELRDGLTPDEARARIASQLPDREKLAVADRVIDNSFTREALAVTVAQLLTQARAAAKQRPN